ncbi:MAG TPA: alpha/beta hydrolase [Rhodanobacteraceae bacterium]|nr:alpha/beta hydrolase [Rhodanobacteraceae bacterium]
MNPPSELRVVTASGALAALAWGDPDLPPLIVLHGWLDNAASFGRVAPLLAAHRRVIALDLPGHGHSAHLPAEARRYHFVDQIDGVLDAADALGLAQFDLLGHSLGAGIAAMVAAATPARIGRLALIEGLGPLADGEADTLRRWREAYAPRGVRRRSPRIFPTVEDAVAARVAAGGGLAADEVRPIVERNLEAVADGFAWRSDTRLRRATPLRAAEAQVRHVIAGIVAPTLLLLADPATPYLPTAVMSGRAACVPHITVARVTGPHHLHIRHPEAVAARLTRFLDT